MEFNPVRFVALAIVLFAGCQSARVPTPVEHATAVGELTAPAVVAHVEEEPDCGDSLTNFVTDVDAIAAELRDAGTTATVSRLVELDARIRSLVDVHPADWRCIPHASIYKKVWDEIGIRIAYNEELEYSGVLLRRAHAIDPNSSDRASTLFATIRDEERHSFKSVPDLRACRRYEKEFPNGPFAKDVYLAVASVHKEIFMILRDGETGHSWYCLDEKLVTSKSQKPQLRREQRLALEYYDKALEIDPTDEDLMKLREETANGTVNTWTYCGC